MAVRVAEEELAASARLPLLMLLLSAGHGRFERRSKQISRKLMRRDLVEVMVGDLRGQVESNIEECFEGWL